MLKQVLFVITSILLYSFSPKEYNFYLCLASGIIFAINFFYYYSKQKRKNHFDFDTIFSITFFITLFIYPIFIYPNDATRFVTFAYGFDHTTINKATCLSLVAYSSYILGRFSISSCTLKPTNTKIQNIPYIKEKYKYSLYTYVLIVTAFIAFGGLNQLSSLYEGSYSSGSHSILNYLSVCITPTMVIALITQSYYQISVFHRIYLKNIDKRLLTAVFLFSLLILSTGSRGLILATCLLYIWWFSHYRYPLSFTKVILMVILGCLVLSIIGILRIRDNMDSMLFLDLFQDLIINNRNSFLAIHMVEQDGFTYGLSMLGYLLRAIPFLSGLVHNLFDLTLIDTASSYAFTFETFGYKMTVGVGSNIVADLYLAFGLAGVILGMFGLGRFISYLEKGVIKQKFYSTLIYATMMSQSVFLVRADYFWTLNIIVTTIILYSFIHLFVELFHKMGNLYSKKMPYVNQSNNKCINSSI